MIRSFACLALASATGALLAQEPEQDLQDAIAQRDARGVVRLAGIRAAEAERHRAGDRLALASELEGLAASVSEVPGPEVAGFVETQLLRSLELQEAVQGRDRVEHLKTLEKLSDLYFTAGRWQRSEAIDRRCLAIKAATYGFRDVRVAETQRNLSLSLVNQGKFRSAETLLREAVATLELADPKQPLDLAKALNDLADNLRAQNRYREATPLFEHSVRLAEQAVGPQDAELVALLSNLGGLYRDTNRFAESQWRLNQALQISEASSHPDPVERVTLWNNLAELHRFQNDFAEAERLYRKAIDLGREALGEDHPKLATYLNQLAELYVDQALYDKAEPLYRQALALRLRVLGPEHLDVAYTQKCLGQLFTLSGRFAEAEQSLRQALVIQEQRLGPRHPDVAISLEAMAEAVDRSPSRTSEARAWIDRALRIFEATQAEPQAQARAYAYRATLKRRENSRGPAREDLARALDIVERLRPEAGGGEHTRARYFSRFVAAFQRMVSWQVEAGDLPRAFAYAERARSRALMDQLAAGGVDLRSGIEPGERARLERRESDVQSRLAEYRRRLQDLYSQEGGAGAERRREIEELVEKQRVVSAEFQQVYEEIKNASRFWRASGSGGGQTLGLRRVQRELVRSGGLMLFYVIGDEEGLVLVIPPSGRSPTAHRLSVSPSSASALGIEAGPLTASRLRRILAPDASDAPEGLLPLLSSPPPAAGRDGAFSEALHTLWQVLVPDEVWAQVRRCSEVVLVPDGLLHQLPFEALVTSPASGDEQTRYWLDEGPVIRYAASATALARLTRDPAAAGTPSARVVSVSDPIFDLGEPSPKSDSLRGGRRLERLPGTARESEAIQKAFATAGSRAEVVVLQRLEARESRVRAALPGARYIHLATHGLVDETQGDLLATLALTPPPAVTESTDDGQLQLYEIYGLDLRSELAVLSSCESRVGRLVSGEGVFALSRAFLAAGTRRVVASLWPAEDDATAEIVSGFFETLALADARGAAPDFGMALTQAKRRVRTRRAWADPFFWGPFVLEGAR